MKKKVLFLIESLSGGGAEKVLSVLIKHFDYSKYDVTVCPVVDVGVYTDVVKEYATNYAPIMSFKGNFISKIWNRIKYKLIYSILPLKWVYKVFIPQGNEIEIAFCEGFATKLLAHSKSSSKKIAWIHTDLENNPWTTEIGVFKNIEEERETYAVYDKIVCVSKMVLQSFCKLYGLNDKVITIYNPIDVDDIRQKAGKKVNKGNDIVHIISVGRLVPQKGFDRLLRVIKRMHEEGNPVKLVILGNGVERNSLEDYMVCNDMETYVSIPGFSNNPYEQINQSDLFVCSSRAEGFSLVIAEAMTLGVPVVSTCCMGPCELLQEGKCGMLVDNSEEGLYTGLNSALNNMSKLNDYVEIAQERIKVFIPQTVIGQIELLIDG